MSRKLDLTKVLEEEMCHNFMLNGSLKDACYYGAYEMVHCPYYEQRSHGCKYKHGNPVPMVILSKYEEEVYGDVPDLPMFLKKQAE